MAPAAHMALAHWLGVAAAVPPAAVVLVASWQSFTRERVRAGAHLRRTQSHEQ